jgi:hypothetical protein
MRQYYVEDHGLYPDDVATQCAKSIKVKDVDFRVPCGKCIPCKRKRRADWTLRLEHEYQGSDSAYFITLTYDDVHVPKVKWKGYETNVLTLKVKHLQNYIKRLRNSHVAYVSRELGIRKSEVKNVSKPIRYYAIGEYGSKTHRPHYHLLLFNYDIANTQTIIDQWKNTQTNIPFGHVDIGNVTGASINYVTKYMFKDFNRKKDIRVPNFTLMSKGRRFEKDGKTPNRWSIIGSYYLKNYGGWHKFNETLNTRDSKGSRRRLPKAYLHRIWEQKEKRLELSKRDYNRFISEKLEKFNKQKMDHYNSEVRPILKSKDSDYQRQLNHIINLETL